VEVVQQVHQVQEDHLVLEVVVVLEEVHVVALVVKLVLHNIQQ
jgi:hypothetical protein